MHCRLHCCPAHAGKRCDLVDWKIADTMAFDLAGNDAQNGTLPFGVMLPQIVRERTRAAKRPAAVP